MPSVRCPLLSLCLSCLDRLLLLLCCVARTDLIEILKYLRRLHIESIARERCGDGAARLFQVRLANPPSVPLCLG